MNLKKTLAFVSALTMAAACVPVSDCFDCTQNSVLTANAAVTALTTGCCGKNVIWTLNGTVLTISGTGNMGAYHIKWTHLIKILTCFCLNSA